MDTIRETPRRIRRCDSMVEAMDRCARYGLLVSLILAHVVGLPAGSSASRPLLIVASPAVKHVVAAPARVTIECGFPFVAVITRSALSELGLTVGASVRAAFKAGSVHLIPRR